MHKLRNLITLLLLVLVTSCGLGYENSSNNIEKALLNNRSYHFNNPAKSSTNYLLLNQEAGLFYFLQNDPNKSLNYFNSAIFYYRKLEESSRLNLRKALSFTVLSDTLITYEGSNYERGLVHYYSGLNYLLQQDLNKAAVEFKAAEENQKNSEILHQKKIIASENQIEAFLRQNNLKSTNINQALAESKEIRAQNRNKFLNGNILYVAGLVREINKSYNEALVNYKQAYVLQPNNTYLLQDLYRLSLIYDQSYATYLKNNNPIINNFNVQNYNKQNTVYLIYEQGFVPKRENLKIPLVGVDNSLVLTINLPLYNAEIPYKQVSLEVPSQNLVALAQESANIYTLAKNQLIENYPIIIARQISKLATQIAGQKVLQSNNATPLSLIFSGFYLFDSADLRSWRTLPNYTKIAKISSDSSLDQVVVNINNRSAYTMNLNLSQGELAIVYVFDSGKQLYAKLLYKGTK